VRPHMPQPASANPATVWARTDNHPPPPPTRTPSEHRLGSCWNTSTSSPLMLSTRHSRRPDAPARGTALPERRLARPSRPVRTPQPPACGSEQHAKNGFMGEARQMRADRGSTRPASGSRGQDAKRAGQAVLLKGSRAGWQTVGLVGAEDRADEGRRLRKDVVGERS